MCVCVCVCVCVFPYHFPPRIVVVAIIAISMFNCPPPFPILPRFLNARPMTGGEATEKKKWVKKKYTRHNKKKERTKKKKREEKLVSCHPLFRSRWFLRHRCGPVFSAAFSIGGNPFGFTNNGLSNGSVFFYEWNWITCDSQVSNSTELGLSTLVSLRKYI